MSLFIRTLRQLKQLASTRPLLTDGLTPPDLKSRPWVNGHTSNSPDLLIKEEEYVRLAFVKTSKPVEQSVRSQIVLTDFTMY